MPNVVPKPRFVFLLAGFSIILAAPFAMAVAPTGGFLAVQNDQNNLANGDSQRSITFFDADEIGFGGGGSTGGPLFSVFLPFEDGVSNVEDPSSITVDPATGDVYVLAFDSGNPTDGLNNGDTSGTFDLYRIPFATVYGHWSTNFQGQDVRTLGGALTVGGRAPTTPNDNNKDYITYGLPTGDFGTGAQKGTITFSFAGGPANGHSNTFGLAGVIEKVGEVDRNRYATASNFYPTVLEFIDSTHLLMIDDDRVSHPSSIADDHDYRLIERVSAVPDAATSDGINGGYNGQTTQSWKSTRIGQVLLDAADASEPESGAFYVDPISGVRGMWVTESDFSTAAGGDAVQFLQLDNSNAVIGYRPFASGPNPLPSPLDNDPFAGNDNRGSADNVFVDKDSGDLIIVESSFGDAAALVGADTEPGVLRVPIVYDNGSGEIAVGPWSQKMILNPTKDPNATPRLERGHWSSYDSANNIVYFFDPGDTGDTPQFQVDVYALDLDTGLTTSHMNVDDSVSLFLGDGFGDKVTFFSIAAPGVAGDFNQNNKVDAGDYVIWRANQSANLALPNDNGVGNQAARFALWRQNFGNPGAGGGRGAAVPEPSSLALLLLGLLPFGLRRRSK